MVPATRARPTRSRTAPRTRGDGPGAQHSRPPPPVLLPAPAGMVPAPPRPATSPCTAPRTRGDGPGSEYWSGHGRFCSPHPRGWSQMPYDRQPPSGLLPAPAGMVPWIKCVWFECETAPRTRGDGPLPWAGLSGEDRCSPHPRGWSLKDLQAENDRLLLPAPAGMVPSPAVRAGTAPTAPRTRGDGPGTPKSGKPTSNCSPHPRDGPYMSPVGDDPRHCSRTRGMVPSRRTAASTRGLLPRTPRGWSPLPRGGPAAGRSASPHPRGWSLHKTATFTASHCSPHPRGWSLSAEFHSLLDALLPAPAGMVPTGRRPRRGSRPAPRTRGDGPLGLDTLVPARLLPAPAGMVPRPAPTPARHKPAPRTRGDGPGVSWTPTSSRVCSPHPRGWSLDVRPATDGTLCSPHPRGWSHRLGEGRDERGLLPAPAGMVPGHRARGVRHFAAPRTRGDGPLHVERQQTEGICSPHPRGWSLSYGSWGRVGNLLPAPAGMVPSARSTPRRVTSAPRTRGDGPDADFYWLPEGVCSPHPRGWSQELGEVVADL